MFAFVQKYFSSKKLSIFQPINGASLNCPFSAVPTENLTTFDYGPRMVLADFPTLGALGIFGNADLNRRSPHEQFFRNGHKQS